MKCETKYVKYLIAWIVAMIVTSLLLAHLTTLWLQSNVGQTLDADSYRLDRNGLAVFVGLIPAGRYLSQRLSTSPPFFSLSIAIGIWMSALADLMDMLMGNSHWAAIIMISVAIAGVSYYAICADQKENGPEDKLPTRKGVNRLV